MRCTAAVSACCLLLVLAAAPVVADDAPIANRWGLLIGVDDYAVAPDLEFCGNDQRELRDKLLKCGFDDDHLFLLHDKAADAKYHPSRGNIERELDLVMSLADENDLLLIAFSGHGTAMDGKNYLCPSDATFDDPASLVSLDAIYDKLSQTPARFKLMMVDACRDDRREGNTRSFAPADKTRSLSHGLQGGELPRGVVLLNSCGPGEQSWEEEKVGHGVYMYHVLEGLSGAADKNGDGALSLYELQSYAGDKTKTYVAHRFSQAQRPYFKGDLSTEALEFALLPVSKAAFDGAKPSLVESPPQKQPRSTDNPLESTDDLLKDLGGTSMPFAGPGARPSPVPPPSTTPPPSESSSVPPPSESPPPPTVAPPALTLPPGVPPAPASAYPGGVVPPPAPPTNDVAPPAPTSALPTSPFRVAASLPTGPAAPAASSGAIDITKLALPPRFEVRLNEPWIGAAAMNVFGTSFEIRGVLPGGPAAIAGLQPLDRLLAIAGEKVSNEPASVPSALISKHDPGETISIEIERGGRTLTLAVTLVAMPEDQGVSQLVREAEAGHTWAMVELGRRFGAVDATGLELVRNNLRAVQWYRAAADAGSAAGMLHLAEHQLFGDGISKDESAARAAFERLLTYDGLDSSPSIQAKAAMDLGIIYIKGWGVDANVDQALAYYERAQALGYAVKETKAESAPVTPAPPAPPQ